MRESKTGISGKGCAAIVLAAALAFPQAVLASNQTFANIHYLISTGEKAKEVKGRLVLTDDSIQVHGYRGGGVVQEILYADVKAATYSKSKHPRWKSGLITAAALGVFAIPVFFMKGKKHWITVQAEGEHAALRLSKKNYSLILAAFESKTGVGVERIVE